MKVCGHIFLNFPAGCVQCVKTEHKTASSVCVCVTAYGWLIPEQLSLIIRIKVITHTHTHQSSLVFDLIDFRTPGGWGSAKNKARRIEGTRACARTYTRADTAVMYFGCSLTDADFCCGSTFPIQSPALIRISVCFIALQKYTVTGFFLQSSSTKEVLNVHHR